MNGVMMHDRLTPGVEGSLDRSVLEGDHEDHSLVLTPLAALGHISNGLCGSPDVTSSMKCEEPSVSSYQGPNPGWTVSVSPPRALLPVPISTHSVSVPPSWTECANLATFPGGGRHLTVTVTDLPPSSEVLDVVTTTHPDCQGPKQCDADTQAEMSDDPRSSAQTWTGGPKTALMEGPKTALMGGPKTAVVALSNIAPTDLNLGDDPSLQPGPMVAVDVVVRSGDYCDDPEILLESPTDSLIVPYLEPSWPIQAPILIPLGATLPRLLVTGGGGVIGGPQGVEEDIYSVKDPSVPTPETKKEIKMVSFPDSTQFFNTEDCLNQQMPSCQDSDKLNSVSHDIHTRYLKVPKQIQTNEQPYPCSVCKKEFDCKSNLHQHQRISLREKPYNRSVCPKTCPQTSNLHQHRKFHTGEKPNEGEKPNQGEKPNHTGEKNLKRVHTGEKPYECSVCSEVFRQFSTLNKHKRTHTGENPYECSVCSKNFCQLSHLNSHKLVHTGDKPYNCSVCSEVFRQLSTLNKHKRTHTGEKPYKCSVCSKNFSHLSHLNSHKRVHTGEKPYECSVCSKNFSQLSNLNKHKRTHTGEKPYKCSVCSKDFRQLSNLNTHKLVHTGEKPYKCCVCSKDFNQSSNLNSHKRVHTGEKPYKCSVCSKVFRHLFTLNKHKRVHTELHTKDKS